MVKPMGIQTGILMARLGNSHARLLIHVGWGVFFLFLDFLHGIFAMSSVSP
jgi:hypothetical protein